MRRSRQTKIVATLGPSSGSEERLASLFQAGADVFRFNFSHGTHEEHAARLKNVRALEARVGRPVGVFADLQGPKLRLGHFAKASTFIESGNHFRLDLSEEPGTADRAPLPHPEIFATLRPGARLALDDGRVQLEVIACGPDFADTKVLAGGALSDHKGVNLPNVVLDVSPLTAKDRRDLDFILEIGIGVVALSFVQRPEDIEDARRLIAGRAHLIAKLEKPSAVEHLEDIVDLADAVMVAAGVSALSCLPKRYPPFRSASYVSADRRENRLSLQHKCSTQWSLRRCRRGPKPLTWQMPFMKAPTRSCSRPRPPSVSIRCALWT